MRILLIKLNHLGDTLLLTPTLRALAEKFPGCTIDVMVRRGTEAMLQGNPDVNVIPIASPEKHNRSIGRSLSEFGRAIRTILPHRYDYAFDLSNSDRAALWVTLSRARIRGINTAYGIVSKRKQLLFNRFSTFEWVRAHQVLRDYRTVMDIIDPASDAPGPLRFHPQSDAATIAQSIPFTANIDNFVVIHPTSRWTYKQWIPERWGRLADRITRERGLKVIFSCGPEPKEVAYVESILKESAETHFSTAGKTSIHDLAWLLGRCRLFVGVDTVAMHLAAAMQARTVALFGPSSEWSWHPWFTKHELVLGPCECKKTRKFVCDKSKPYPCMSAITEEAVAAAIEKVLT